MTTTTLNTQNTAATGNKINWQQAILAGFVGTIVFDIIGFLLTGQFWDLPILLSTKLLGEPNLLVGLMAHFGNGFALGILYAGLAPSLWGNRWAKAITFMTAETVALVYLFMMPLLGMGMFGLNAGIEPALITLARHLAFAVPLALLIPLNETN